MSTRDTLRLTLTRSQWADLAQAIDTTRKNSTAVRVPKAALDALMRDQTTLINRLHAAGVETREEA